MKKTYPQSPKSKYSTQRSFADRRGIEWKLTFEEWWKIWQDSGHWHERGRGHGKYCMCRIGDKGAYEVGNVFIDTNAENVADASARRAWGKQLPRGVRWQKGKFYATRMVNGVQHHIGTFLNVESASLAYQNFVASVASSASSPTDGQANDRSTNRPQRATEVDR